ncbi:MAG: hypothetical protein AAGB34_10435 [Planctomycetota bacterium]
MSRMEQLEKLRAADPSDADVPYMIAQEHVKAGDHAAAVTAYDDCLALDANYLYAYFHKARSLEAAGDSDGVAKTLREGLERAQQAGDQKAIGEIGQYLSEIEA